MSDPVFPHVLAALVLVSRLADVGSTYLASPGLLLEANPIARRIGWPFAMLTLGVCLLPYYSTATGVAVLTVSFLVAGSNLSRCWVMRALGEREYRTMLERAVSRARLSTTVAFILASASCPAVVGALLVSLSAATEWGYWFGIGIVLYAIGIGFYGTLFAFRLFRRAREDA